MSAGEAATWMVFSREAEPEEIASAEMGRPSLPASNFRSAWFALPFSGTARTLAFRHDRPSASISISSIASRADFGVNLTSRRQPSLVASRRVATEGVDVKSPLGRWWSREAGG